MKRWVSIAGVGFLSLSLPGVAQQANQNINVLPVSDAALQDAELIGDLYLQRQVEPTIAVSTRNPDHVIAFFNDYRAVDIADDIGLGETQNVAEKKGLLDWLLAWFRGRPEPAAKSNLPDQVAAAEAWVGGSRSYDGGITWSGFFVPGATFDPAQASLDSPVYGLEAATDPVAAAAPCGKVEVVWLAFTRGGQSKMVVSTYEDLNNDEGGDTWRYLRTSVLEIGNNALHGYFLDKPFLIVDPKREEGAGCGYNVYASYTTFNGQESDGKFRSKVTFARSIDSGATYSTRKLNAPFHQNQGTWIAVDPRAGTPNSTGGGTIHLFWRHFFNPDTILTIDSTNYGSTFPGNPKKLTGNESIAAFDQPSLGIGAVATPLTDLTFRSNGFPAATVTREGVILVAWQERVDITPSSPAFGQPDPLGSPRIVMMRSLNGGNSWEGFDPANGAVGPRQAVDFGDRDQPGDPTLPPDGFGALPLARPSGPQVMPALSCGSGRCMLTYYESRGLFGVDLVTQEEIINPVGLSPTTGFISGYDRLLDLRAALFDPLTSERLSTSQVSRYPISVDANFADMETVDDIDQVCSPKPSGGVLCRRRLNAFGRPQSAAGTTPFGGDYTFSSPSVPLVPDIGDIVVGDWRWATEAADVPYQAFHAIWADNRNLAPPTVPDTVDEVYRYSTYGPPNVGGACVNGGSRNTDVLTARVDAELIVAAPTTYKQLDQRRGFPLSVTNGTDQTRTYHLAITLGDDRASFALNDPTVDFGDVTVFRYSSIAQVVYVDSDPTGAAGPIQVTITETGGCGVDPSPPCQTGVVTFNPDPNNPDVVGLGAETQEPSADNPFVINPFVINESLSNPFVINPFVINPFVINTAPGEPEYEEIEAIVDTTWTVSSSETSTASSYLSLINIDNAEQYFDDYIFQLITYRTSSNGGLDISGDACAPFNIPQDQIISNVYNDPANPFVINPFVINPFVINPFVINPFVINSTFTMAPGDGTGSSPDFNNPELDDGTTKAPRRPDEVKVTLRAYQITPTEDLAVAYRPDLDPPSYSVVSLPCDPAVSTDCLFSTAPDLLPVLGPDPLATGTVTVGQTIEFPANGWTLENQGRTDATADESGRLRHGFYLSSFNPEGWLEANPGKTTTDMIAEPGFRSLGVYEISELNPLQAGLSEEFVSSSLTIPTDLTGGEYFLVLFVDDLLEVSENNEVNNFELASFSIIVEVNTAPVAVDDSFTTDEDTPYPGSLGANDDEGDDLTFALADPLATKGEVELDTDTGAFTYTPDPDVNGSDSFGFIASDYEFDSNLGTISVTITAINDIPVPTEGQTFDVPEDGSLSDTLLATDADADDVLSFAVVPGTGPTHGVLVLNPDGSFVYSPDRDFAGTDTFEFTVCDQNDVCSTVSAVVIVSVQASADPPELASIGPKIVDEGMSRSFGVSATDPDVGDTLTLTSTGEPSFCSFASTGPTATFDCSPDFTQSGIYDITVTVTDSGTSPLADSETFVLTVVEVNRAPALTAIGSQTVDEGGILEIVLSATDVDVGDTLTLGVAGLPSFCTFDSPVSGEGTISCSPDFTDAGSNTLTVTVTDDGEPNLTDSESFTLTVDNVNQAPDLDPIGPQSVNEGASLTIALTASDPDAGSTLRFSVSKLPVFCSLSDSSGPTGAIDCSPDFTSSRSYTFTVTVTDDGTPPLSDSAVVTLTVGEVNRAPVLASIGTQSVNEGGSLTIGLSATDADAADTLSFGMTTMASFCTFTPLGPGTGSIQCLPGFVEAGAYPVTVTVTDDGVPILSDSETFTLNVIDVNREPVTFADSVEAEQNGSVTFDPVFNSLGIAVADSPDFDPDVEDTVSLEGVTIDTDNGGKVTSSDNLVTYVPGPNFIGIETLTYIVSDGLLESPGSITVTVLDGVPDWGFVGLQSPWKARPTPRVNLGSAFPVRWQYADSSTGEVVDSVDAMPEVRIKGPYDNCSSAGNGEALEIVLFPGNSGYQYDDRRFIHQLNWDTNGAVKGACYWIRVYSAKTWQINDQTDDGDLFVLKIK